MLKTKWQYSFLAYKSEMNLIPGEPMIKPNVGYEQAKSEWGDWHIVSTQWVESNGLTFVTWRRLLIQKEENQNV